MEKLKKKANDGLTAIFPLEYRADDSSDRAAVVGTVGEGELRTCAGERRALAVRARDGGSEDRFWQ
jgi:hypothetical protein